MTEYYVAVGGIGSQTPVTTGLTVESVTLAVQERLDKFASTRGYDNVTSSAKYKDITDQEIDSLPVEERPYALKFRAESRYLALVTTSTWARLCVILDDIVNMRRPMPTDFFQLELELPVLEWPV